MKNRVLAVFATAASALFLAISPVRAIPVTWTFEATFTDGRTAKGSFVYDADLGLSDDQKYSAVDILTSGANRPDQHYTSVTNAASPVFFSAVSSTGEFELIFLLFSPTGLTNDGGTIAVDTANSPGEIECEIGTNCQQTVGDGVNSVIDTGNVAATPIPGAIPLFASGLGVLGFMTWRRRRAA